MVFTDPPYALFGNSTGVQGVTDDSMAQPFFLSMFRRIRETTKRFGHVYVCCDWHSAFAIQKAFSQIELEAKNLIIWDKGDGGLGSMYQQCHEMIWFISNIPSVKNTTVSNKATGERRVNGQSNIWRYNRTKSNRVHTAQKPLELVVKAIINSSDEGEIVTDLFGGSGTTLIAAEDTGRKCRMMEKEPKWCDVIIERWQQHTGKTARLVSSAADR